MMNLRNYLRLLVISLLLPCSLLQANWQPLQQIGTVAPVTPTDPGAVSVDPNGNAVSVQDINGTTEATTRPFNGVWSLPVNLSLAGRMPDVEVDSGGNALAIWKEGAFIFSAVYTFGVGWGPGAPIEANLLNDDQQVQVSSNGNASGIWQSLGALRYGVKTPSIFAPWSSIGSLATTVDPLGFPTFDLAISDNGTSLAVWANPAGGLNQQVQARTISPTGVLSVTTPLSGGLNPIPLREIATAMDSAGNGIAVWTETDTIFSAVFIGGSWFPLGPIPGTAGVSDTPDVAMDNAGNAVAVWSQTGVVDQIRAAFLPFGTGVWQNTTTLSGVLFNAEFPKVGIDGNGNAVAIWIQNTSPTSQVVQGATLPAGTLAWGPAVTLSANVVNGTIVDESTKLSINDAGNVIAAWLLSQTTPSTTAQSSANSIPSTDTSSITASPTTVIANGLSSSTVTVTLLDGNGVPIVGNTVVLTQNGSATILPAASGITNASGQVVFTVRDNTPQTVTFTATDQQTTIVIGSVNVNFIVSISPGLSTAVAVPTVVEANNVDTSTITVTLRDSGGNLLAGRTVQLTQNLGASSTITPLTGVTNGAGQVQFTVRDAVVEAVTYTARDITDPGTPVPVNQQPVVNFVPPETNPGNSTVVAVPTSVQADGIDTSIITVTLLNDNSNPVPGHTVQLTQSAGGNSIITPLSPVTNAAGEATFSVRNFVVESVTYTATDLTDAVVVTDTATVDFTELKTDPNLSTIVAVPTIVIADGVDFSTITVTLRNINGVPISGHDVMLQQNGSSSITPLVGTTNAFGQVQFTVRDLVSEVVTYTATDITDGIQITPTAQVTFIPRRTDAAESSVVANPTSVFADCVSFSTITVTLRNVNGVPVVGHNVILTPDGGSSTISPPSGPSDANGVVTFTVRDCVVETVIYTATDLTDGVVIDQTATVNFTPPPPAPPSNFKGVVVTNTFATQTEICHILTFDPSPDPNVAFYRIFENGVLARTIPASGPFRAVFNRRCDDVTYVYRLVAVSNQGVESSPLFVTLP